MPQPKPSPSDDPRALIVLDFTTTLVLGALVENVEVNGYDVLDLQNWSYWLHAHGIQDATLSSPVARTTVNICYQSSQGDTSLPPPSGAGAYLNWTLKSFGTVDISSGASPRLGKTWWLRRFIRC